MSYVKAGFLCEASDVEWLKDTHLKGVILPTNWKGFESFVLQGHEDMPYAVNLYLSATPSFDDDYLRVVFMYDTIYCHYQVYDGKTDQPK